MIQPDSIEESKNTSSSIMSIGQAIFAQANHDPMEKKQSSGNADQTLSVFSPADKSAIVTDESYPMIGGR